MQRSLDVTWNITKKCLFNCKICATKNNRIELNKDEKQLLVESLCSSKEYSIHELDFAGEDPLVDPDSVETICLAQRNLGKEKVSVTTTWRGIDALNKRKIKEILYNCELSMDLEDNDAWRSEYTYSAGNYKAIENYYQYIKNLTINIPIGHTYSEQAMKLLCWDGK